MGKTTTATLGVRRGQAFFPEDKFSIIFNDKSVNMNACQVTAHKFI
jgi:hypothetical protein